jgi:hypothetical protein
MNEATKAPEEFEELAGLVKASFPDIRCLRCGHDVLYLVSDDLGGLPGYISAKLLESSITNRPHPFLTLTCTRCGHVEHFLTGILERAEKPIRPALQDE